MELLKRPPSGCIQESNPDELSPLIQRIYASRGIDSMEELHFSLKQLIPISQLAHIEQAADLLADCIEQQASILIVGDFDADGATATAVACRALSSMGAKHVNYLVSNRFEYGYGLTPEIVTEALRFSPDLIVTVDHGVSSIEGVQFARNKGIQVLVTDHHLPGKELPNANVLVNPNLKGDDFSSKALAGVGVIFYVMLALKKCLQARGYFSKYQIIEPNLLALLDLVALGTVADVVSLDANNRILVEQGLRRVRAGQCCAGITALFEVAGGNARRAVASDFGFTCGPRLNAAGRLDDMSLGIECLLSDSIVEARKLASALNDLNVERRAIEVSMKNEAMNELEALNLCSTENIPAIYCLYNESWHQGVVGILASRIKEKFNRPVIAFAPDDTGEIKGSARSIEGIHMRDLLDEVASKHPELLNKFGGHAMAAGLSLKRSDFEQFQQVIHQIAQRYYEDDTFQEKYFTDGELTTDDFTLETAEMLRSAAPWGQHFPAPVFDGKFIILKKTILKEIHIRLSLKPIQVASSGNCQPVPAIGFNVDPTQWPDDGSEVHLLFRLDVNEYRGLLSPQIVIEALL